LRRFEDNIIWIPASAGMTKGAVMTNTIKNIIPTKVGIQEIELGMSLLFVVP